MQFSIRHLMAWTVVVALACAVLFAVPSVVGVCILGLGMLWLPVLLVCGVIYARGWRRTFFIGAIMAAAPFLLPLLVYMPMLLIGSGLISMDLSEMDAESATIVKFAMAAFFAYVGGTGLVALFSRWLVSPREAVPAPAATPSQYAVLQGRFVTEPLLKSE